MENQLEAIKADTMPEDVMPVESTPEEAIQANAQPDNVQADDAQLDDVHPDNAQPDNVQLDDDTSDNVHPDDDLGGDITCMWREMVGFPDWRIQSSDSHILRALSRKAGMTEAGQWLSCRKKVYRFTAVSPDNARRTFTHVTGRPARFNAATGLYWAPNTSEDGRDSDPEET